MIWGVAEEEKVEVSAGGGACNFGRMVMGRLVNSNARKKRVTCNNVRRFFSAMNE